MRRLAFSLIGLFFLLACGGGNIGGGGVVTPPPGGGGGGGGTPQIALTQVVTGLSSPLDLQASPDNTNRLFVVEQGGRIKIIQNGAVAATPFLDISSKVTNSGEMGLLGLAFHPSYAQNRKFYVNYVRTNAGQRQTVIAEYLTTSTDANVADPNSERIMLVQNQPFDNHKGGQLAFGPDGFLYIGLGDGGSSGDPNGNGQNTQTLLGKMLRISVDPPFATGKQYGIPGDNPFFASGGLPEIWAYGFRNPWRFSFDSSGGRLFVGDVGQNSFEEVDLVTKGANYGWNVMEGTHCFNPSTNCNQTGLTLPIHDYPRTDGTTVIGGYVYRGTAVTNLPGAYVFGDFGNGKIWMLQQNNSTWTRTDLLSSGKQISAFGRDSSGELYVVDITGSIFKIVKA